MRFRTRPAKWACLRLEGRDIQAPKAGVGYARQRLPSTSIDDGGHSQRDGSVSLNQRHRLSGRSSGGDHVLNDEGFFFRMDLETASQSEHIIVSFYENGPAAEIPAEFMSDNDGSDGRGNDQVGLFLSQAVGQQGRTGFRISGPLQYFGALEILRTVKARTEQKMPVNECARIDEHLFDPV